jgi:DNA-binding NtrC family response regulator
MNGVDFLQAVTSQEPDVAGVLMAASGDYRGERKAGSYRVLLKPVEPARLRAMVRQLASIVRMKRTVNEVRDKFA